jgi:CRISPR-associated endoribonuclease Cas6
MIEMGSRKTLVVSSPDRDMIVSLNEAAIQISGEQVRIGQMEFKLEGARILDTSIPNGFREFTVDTGTPIIVRIPKHRLKEYEIAPAHDYDYVYWRKEYTPTPFIKQLEENLIKKYGEFSGTETDETPIFEKVRFLKQVAVPFRMNQRETTVIGTLWEFLLRALDNRKRDMLQFALDTGFGEMNSLGFGFMNMRTGNLEGASN